jgi:hypothetical protein
MPRLYSTLQKLDFETKELLEGEYRATLVHLRRMLCSHNDLLKIEVPRFYCESCFLANVDGVFLMDHGPHVQPETWETDMANALGDEEFNSPRCQSCRRDLYGVALYVETVLLAELLSISDEATAIEPSRRLRNEVLKFYERRCFACGSTEDLRIDHVKPRSKGGNAAFENLQPLCEKCGNAKGNRLPRNIVIVRDPWSDQN